MNRGLRRARACAIGLGLSFIAFVGFAENPPPLVLPKIDVTAEAEKRESWRYSEVAGWEVFSQVSDARARDMVQNLRKFDFALRTIQPRLAGGLRSALTIVIVNEVRYKTLVRPGHVGGGVREFSTLFHRSGRSAIIVNNSAEFALPDSELNSNTIDRYRELDRQYLRYVLEAQNARIPGWLEEGLAQVLADVEYRGSWINYGRVDTEQNQPVADAGFPVVIEDFLAPNGALAGLSFKQVFAHRSFMPLGVFFAAARADGTLPSSDSAWAKQAYAFVHFCLFGKELHYREGLVKLANELATQPMTEQLFNECFGVNYATMEMELNRYIRYTRHKYQRYPLRPDQRLRSQPIEFRVATIAELARIRWLEE